MAVLQVLQERSDNDFVNVGFTLFEVVRVAHKCQVIIGDPLFEDIGAAAQGLIIAIPFVETRLSVTVVLGIDEEIFPAKLKL